MKHQTGVALAIFAAVTAGQGARADGITDNSSLVSPPGVYFGTGNSNSGFTVDTTGNVEIGLSAVDRFIAPITPTGDVYQAPLGNTTVPLETGSAWGVTFSINLKATPAGTLTLSQIDPVLVVTDTNTGFNKSFNDFIADLPDNACYGGSGVDSNCTNFTSDYGVQNSEPGSLLANPLIGDTGFNDALPDVYDYTIDVYQDCDSLAGCTSADLLASDTIVVDAVPEPASLVLLGAALFGFGAVRRWRKAGA